MVRTIASLVAVALALSVITAIAQDSDKEKKAISAAEKWLSMVEGSTRTVGKERRST